MNCSETRRRKPLPPTPSPARRGGAILVFLPLSASGRGLGGGVCICALLLTLGLSAAPAAEPQRLTTDGKLKSAPVFANSKEIVFAVHEAPNWVALKRLKLKD